MEAKKEILTSFRVRYTPDNLLKCQLSYSLKSVTVENKHIVCELTDFQADFIRTNQLKLNYIKKYILNTKV
jgi:hypothetical protein